MFPFFRGIFVTHAILFLLFGLPASPGKACGGAFHREGIPVEVAGESAVIVWDAATHMEHFIRRAEFETQVKDFGFLVPTPSMPILASADDKSFTSLERRIQPKTDLEVLTGYQLTSWLFQPKTLNETRGISPAATSVEVVSSQRVGRYDAVVLKADDVAALSRWLKSNGYASRPTLTAWLAPYVAHHWSITAFKIARNDIGNPILSSAAVRMSFHTDKPFFPYSEPADQRQQGSYYGQRLLRVFLINPHRMDGTLGLGASGKPWLGRVAWAGALTGIDQIALAKRLALSPTQLPNSPWMTVFEDTSAPRQGTADLYFSPSPSQTAVLTPPITDVQDRRISIPVEPIVLALLVIVFAVVGMMGRRHRAISQKEGIA